MFLKSSNKQEDKKSLMETYPGHDEIFLNSNPISKNKELLVNTSATDVKGKTKESSKQNKLKSKSKPTLKNANSINTATARNKIIKNVTATNSTIKNNTIVSKNTNNSNDTNNNTNSRKEKNSSSYKRIGIYAIPLYNNDEIKVVIPFLSCDKFEGRKEGYQFSMGKHGLGYYQDVSNRKPILIPYALLPT